LWVAVVGDHQNDELAAFPAGVTTTVLPGILGGLETPMAYSDGVVFAAVNNLATDFTPSTWRLHPFSESTGDLVAIQAATGQILWDHRFNAGNYGGATVVNDLVFTATFDGMIYAFKVDTGEQVWSYQAPAAVNAWPAVAGDTIVWPIAGPGLPSLIAFRLGSTAPGVQLVSPAEGSALPAGDLAVQAEVLNFALAAPMGQPNVTGQGHIVFSLDAAPSTIVGQPIAPTAGVSAASATGSATFTNVSPGPHTVWAILVNHDGTVLSQEAVAKTSFSLDTNPRIHITSPGNGDIVKKGAIKLSVDIANLNLVDSSGQAPVAGEGHIRYSLDGSVATDTTAKTWAFDNVQPGKHVFAAELVANDGSRLSPAAAASVTTYVIEYSGGVGSQ